MTPARSIPPGLLLLLAGAWFANVWSEEIAEKRFDRANVLFEQGDYPQAIESYQALIENDSDSAAVRFNLGNALLRSSRIGEAVFHYRQALTYAPRDPAILTNLKYARESRNPEALSGGWPWLLKLTLNEWTLLTLVPFWVWMIARLMILFQTDAKPYLTIVSRTAFIALLLAGGVLALAALERYGSTTAVVVTEEAIVRYGPFPESEHSHKLEDSAEVRILGHKENWWHIEDASGREGWLERTQVRQLPPRP